MNAVQTVMNSINTKAMAEPRCGLYEFPRKHISITSPIITLPRPPSIFEITNVLNDGANTIVIPEKNPGKLSSRITLKKISVLLAPRSHAASIELSLIPESEV